MAPDRRDPLRDLVALQDRMSRLFEETLRVRGGEEDLTAGGWTPAADIYETPDELVLSLDLPGVDRQAVEVRFDNNVLTIKGERKLPEGIDRRQYHRVERPYGKFHRSFTLPAGASAEKIAAAFDGGVLMIRVPKGVATRSRQIDIS